jgi:hypothetical protein
MSKKIYHQFTCSRMMLPEHRERLRQQQARRQWDEKHRRPLLDDQQKEAFQQALERSMREGRPLKLTVLDSSGCRHLAGTVIRLEPWAGRFRFRTAAGEITILIDEVIHAETT